MPLGLYPYEDDIPGVSSIKLPDANAVRWARKAFEFAEMLDDMKPSLGDAWRWINPFD